MIKSAGPDLRNCMDDKDACHGANTVFFALFNNTLAHSVSVYKALLV